MSDTPQPTGVTPPSRRLIQRLPVRLRQHWKLLALLVVAVVSLTAVFGHSRIRPYITGDVTVMVSGITDNILGRVDLFDYFLPHTVHVDITGAEYQQMIEAYQKDGEKKWVTADVTIDGTVISDVSVRLKGNSTLVALGGKAVLPPGAPETGEPGVLPMAGLVEIPAASADDPTSLPLLISFDENADGRAYQGLTELSVRPGTPVLNEALSLSLTAATNQPTQRYSYAAYTINGQTTTRLLLEHPDEMYANSLFGSTGYLYKADAKSRLEYVGPDQAEYADQFKQINAVDSGNLQPIINFLAWLNGADQREFDNHLSDWVDTESLARYLATQNLLCNGDDMGGPGQNYYLWYDLTTKKISVISWDLNLAMSGGAETQPGDEVQMGPPPGAGAETARPAGRLGTATDESGPRIGNQLKTRFLESAVWMQSYDGVYWDLYDKMYRNGHALALLDEIADSIPITDGLTQQDLTVAVDSMREWIAQRSEVLEKARVDG